MDTPNGATSSAIIYSIAETAKANNLSVYKYYTYQILMMELLPWSNDLPNDSKIQSTKQNE